MQVIHEIDAYCDEVPRAASDVAQVGPFTVFVRRGAGWPYYARPTRGCQDFTPDDVVAVLSWQEERGLAASIEWIEEVTPGLLPVVRAAGVAHERHPLMELRSALRVPGLPEGLQIRPVTRPAECRAIAAVAGLAFGHEGTEVGPQGLAELTEALASAGEDAEAASLAAARDIEAGHLIQLAAFDGEAPVAIGAVVPRGTWAEVAGVGTLPAYRRRGIGLALTGELVRRGQGAGAARFFLSAADGAVARLYRRAGFEHVGHAAVAAPGEPGVTAEEPPAR